MLRHLSRSLTWLVLLPALSHATWIYRPVLNVQTGRPDLITPLSTSTVQAGSNVTVSTNSDGSITIGATGGGGGGGTPASPVNSIQYNNAGSFGGATGASWNSTTGIFTSSGIIPSTDTKVQISSGTPYYLRTYQNYLYVTNQDTDRMQIYDISIASSPVFISSVTTVAFPRSVDVQGRYAYVGGFNSNSIQVIDVTNKHLPIALGTAGASGQVRSVVVQGRYLYALDNNNGKIQAFDISVATAPVNVGSVFAGGQTFSIQLQGRYAYAVNQTSNSVSIVDISTPSAMVLVSSISVGASPRYGFIKGRYHYVANRSSGTLNIIDVSDPAHMVFASTLTVGGAPFDISVQGNYAYYTTSTGGLNVVDVTNPYNPILLGGYSVPGSLVTEVMAVNGNYAYFVENTSNTIRAVELGGSYIQMLSAGGIRATSLIVDKAIQAEDVAIDGGLQVGQSAQFSADVGIQGATNLFGTVMLGGDSTANLYRSAAGTIKTNGTLISSGSIGVGVSPSYKLDVKQDDASITYQEHISNANSTANLYLGTAGSGVSPSSLQNNAVISNSGSSDMVFRTGNAEAMRIQNGGNVGIGTNNPAYLLEIAKASNADLYFHSTDAGGGGMIMRAASSGTGDVFSRYYMGNGDQYTTLAQSSDNSFRIQDQAAPTTHIIMMDTNGQVGIGNAAPTVPFEVTGASKFNSTLAVSGLVTLSTVTVSSGTVSSIFNSPGTTSVGTDIHFGLGSTPGSNTYSTVYDDAGGTDNAAFSWNNSGNFLWSQPRGTTKMTLNMGAGAGANLTVSTVTASSVTVSRGFYVNGSLNVSSTTFLSGSAGTNGQVYTSGGPGAASSWTTISGGGGGATNGTVLASTPTNVAVYSATTTVTGYGNLTNSGTLVTITTMTVSSMSLTSQFNAIDAGNRLMQIDPINGTLALSGTNGVSNMDFGINYTRFPGFPSAGILFSGGTTVNAKNVGVNFTGSDFVTSVAGVDTTGAFIGYSSGTVRLFDGTSVAASRKSVSLKVPGAVTTSHSIVLPGATASTGTFVNVASVSGTSEQLQFYNLFGSTQSWTAQQSWTSASPSTFTALSVSGLTSGRCVQTTTGGRLTVTGAACSGQTPWTADEDQNGFSLLSGDGIVKIARDGGLTGIGTATPSRTFQISEVANSLGTLEMDGAGNVLANIGTNLLNYCYHGQILICHFDGDFTVTVDHVIDDTHMTILEAYGGDFVCDVPASDQFVVMGNGNTGIRNITPRNDLQIGDYGGLLSTDYATDMTLTGNYYYDGNWRYINSDAASMITLTGGAITFYGDVAGVADDVVAPTPFFQITAPPPDSFAACFTGGPPLQLGHCTDMNVLTGACTCVVP